MKWVLWFSAALFAITPLSLAALGPVSAQQSSRDTGSHPERQITIDVDVTDNKGNPVPGLQPQDFTLLDDKQPLTIVSFHAYSPKLEPEDAPRVIIAVDEVNLGFYGVGEARQTLNKFLREDGGRLPFSTSLLLISDTYQGKTPASRDGNVLADALSANQQGLRIIGRSQGVYGAIDRYGIGFKALESLAEDQAAKPGRKLLIWLSPGWPLLSGPGMLLTRKDEDALFDAVVRVNTDLRKARITLYSVDPAGMNDAGGLRTYYYETFLNGVRSSNYVQNGNLGLQVLAVQSGGLVLNSNNDIGASIAKCAADAKAFYTLTFEAPRADRVNEYHSLHVKIDRRGLKARTRTGYYAQP
ncbi:MAG: VWA domain-containing protein [Candidatus Sulfotelmatobacter sp.]